MEIYTKIECSFSLKTANKPLKKAAIPEIAANRKGIVNFKLLKKVAPPLSPLSTKRKNTAKKIAKARIK